jgi:hypothetical protein
MTKQEQQELNKLAREILNTAEVEGDEGEDGYIRVNSDLLFRYYVMGGAYKPKAKKAKKKLTA